MSNLIQFFNVRQSVNCWSRFVEGPDSIPSSSIFSYNSKKAKNP